MKYHELSAAALAGSPELLAAAGWFKRPLDSRQWLTCAPGTGGVVRISGKIGNRTITSTVPPTATLSLPLTPSLEALLASLAKPVAVEPDRPAGDEPEPVVTWQGRFINVECSQCLQMTTFAGQTAADLRKNIDAAEWHVWIDTPTLCAGCNPKSSQYVPPRPPRPPESFHLAEAGKVYYGTDDGPWDDGPWRVEMIDA